MGIIKTTIGGKAWDDEEKLDFSGGSPERNRLPNDGRSCHHIELITTWSGSGSGAAGRYQSGIPEGRPIVKIFVAIAFSDERG